MSSSGLGLKGVIRRVETNLDIENITRMSRIEPMTVIDSGGCEFHAQERASLRVH